MNPNTCTICEMMFTRVMKARSVTIDATVLFVDLRGYTAASQSLAPEQMTSTLDAFYDECADAIWNHDGLLNKTIGDAIMAIFNFPIQQEDHPAQAVGAAREMQERWRRRRSDLTEGLDIGDDALSIGIGISTGDVNFGEFGQSYRDLTAIGTVVNIAARAQSVARAGQILITAPVRDRCGEEASYGEGTTFDLKGLREPIELYDAASHEDRVGALG